MGPARNGDDDLVAVLIVVVVVYRSDGQKERGGLGKEVTNSE
jgi:hypothetical protein